MLKSKTLMRKLILPGIVFAYGMAGTVQAATLSSGPIYGGPSQTRVVCSVINMGTAPFAFVGNNVIFSSFNGSVPLSFNDCAGSLLPGGICTSQAVAAGNQAYACKVTTNGGTVRATMRANDGNNKVLIEEELR